MDQEGPAVNWKKFYVHVSGRTSGAHHAVVADLKRCGQTEVFATKDSDYILLFCVISSRVGTDVDEALKNAPRDKEVILVVMHHTFDHNFTISDSRRVVVNPNVRLVVDCLFHEGELLQCNRTDIALFDIKRFLGVSDSVQISPFFAWLKNNQKKLLVSIVTGVSVGSVLALIVWCYEVNKKH